MQLLKILPYCTHKGLSHEIFPIVLRISATLTFMHMNKTILAAMSGLSLFASAHADSVWAPGVSVDGGWYDFNKVRGNQWYNDDASLCWAASAANVIAWWQEQNKVKGDNQYQTIPQGEDVWKTFVGVSKNVGKNPNVAFDWWINGTTTTPDWADSWDKDANPTWTGIDGTEYHPYTYTTGGILTHQQFNSYPLYDTKLNPVTIVTSYTDIYDYSKKIIDAISSGYALTLSVREGADHAFSLWGVEYDIIDDSKYLINKIWVTDSNDSKSDGTPILTYYDVKPDEEKTVLRFDYGGEYGLFRMERIDGMRTSVIAVPEPTASGLSLLALAGFAARRRRK